jgi:hypothetical protein
MQSVMLTTSYIDHQTTPSALHAISRISTTVAFSSNPVPGACQFFAQIRIMLVRWRSRYMHRS